MKKIFFLFFALSLFATAIYSQNASTYFPASTGYKWYFKNTPLDSNNNPINNLITYRIDSFATVQNYKGRLANFLLSKSNLVNFNQNAPYTDTNYINFTGTDAWTYLNLSMLPDTMLFLQDSGFVNWIKSFENWYSTFRFAQNVGSEYTIFSRDTSIYIDTLGMTVPLTLSLKAIRLNDQTVNTVYGNYLSKKFVSTFRVIYRPFPFINLTLYARPDTAWFASGIWLVKEHIPSSTFSLAAFSIPYTLKIPGTLTELAVPTSIKPVSSEIPQHYELEQNYPNPFNPVTNIRFKISNAGNTKITVFDLLGKEVGILVNQYLQAGAYEVNFNAANLTSGIYFYKLSSGNFTDLKRMILIK